MYYRKIVVTIGGQHDKTSKDRLAELLPTNATAAEIREFLDEIEEMILSDLRDAPVDTLDLGVEEDDDL